MKYTNEQLQAIAQDALANRGTVEYVERALTLAMIFGLSPYEVDSLIERMAHGDFSFDEQRAPA